MDSSPDVKADTWDPVRDHLRRLHRQRVGLRRRHPERQQHHARHRRQSATCTITNDDIAPKLHLRKVVVNDNGGTATVADFTLTADGTGANDLSGTSPVDSGAGLKADTWALSETNVAGYAPATGSASAAPRTASNITVGIGGEATCTITNDDIAPS